MQRNRKSSVLTPLRCLVCGRESHNLLFVRFGFAKIISDRCRVLETFIIFVLNDDLWEVKIGVDGGGT